MEDQAFIARLLAGDEGSIEQVRTWIRASFGPYRSRLASELDDLEQETLLDLTTALRDGRFRGQCRLYTYVRTFVVHKCIDRLRKSTRREWVTVDDLELPSKEPSALDKLTRSEATYLALRVYEQMPESCRQLWQMLQKGMPYREMSRQLRISEGALRARVMRCRRQALELRARLSSVASRNKPDGPSTIEDRN